jgi:hypothetical protein
MSFAFIEPDERHPILHAIFRCDCGRISDQVIVDTNEAADEMSARQQAIDFYSIPPSSNSG